MSSFALRWHEKYRRTAPLSPQKTRHAATEQRCG
jgi:hypothetical protein